MQRVRRLIIAEAMKCLGIPANMSYKCYTRFKDDFIHDKNSSLKEKLWSYKRGFLVSSTRAFGLTPQNYHDYISDVDFYRMYPIDKRFKHWIDDKLTMKYVLSPYPQYLPKYFCTIQKGGVIAPLIDGKNIYSLDDLLSFIQREKQVALKLASSTHGVGFYKLSYDNQFEIDNQAVTEEQLVAFLRTLDEYLVTEYIVAHEAIRKVSCGALNTVRIMVINEDLKLPKLANAIMKFSTKASGLVDNVINGSLFAKVNVLTGEYSDAKYIVDNVYFNCIYHPDTNVEIKGVLPNWREMSDKLIEISQHLSPLTYMGYDIAITDNGFKIIEINSHQGLMMFQCYGPLLRENIAANFFNKVFYNDKR